MSPRTVVVDGSNIATEGRQMPSLRQLDEAVRAYREEHPDDDMIVVVDATFAHRIPEDERSMYEEAAAHNELVYPPAGAVGRGDAFLLRIAEKTGAVVLSNDSFQEFHGEHDWLFEKGRLVGGTPVPGVGWIFVARTPVRGPKSREAVKEAKRTRARVGSKDASQPMPVPKAPPPGPGRGKKSKKTSTAPDDAIAVATEEAVAGDVGDKKRKRRKRRGRGGGAGAVGPDPSALPTLNEPLTFIEFIAEHKLGSEVDGEVESFASHGAFVLIGDARCYIPLSAMGEPPPRSARAILKRGDRRPFVVQALDASRRGIELALPGYERVAGQPTEETIEAEIDEAPEPVHHVTGGEEPPRKGKKKAAKDAKVAKGGKSDKGDKAPKTKKKAAAAKKVTAKKAAKKAVTKKAEPAKRAAPVTKTVAIRKAGAATSTAKERTPAAKKTVVAKAAAPTKKVATATKKATAKKVAAAPKKTAPKKTAPKKVATPAKKAATAPKKSTAKKKAAAKKA